MKFINLLPVLYEMTPEDFDFDFAQRVPTLSIVAMFAAIILSIAVPVFLFIYLKRRFKLEPMALIYALLAYMLGNYLLPSLLIGVTQWADVQTGIFTSIGFVYYILIAVLTAGLGLGGIWLCMRMARKRMPISLGTALLFAIILCAAPVLTETVSYLGNYISIAFTVNQGGLYNIVEEMIAAETASEDIVSLLDAMKFFFNENFFYYLLMAFDVLFLIPINLGVCAIVGGRLNGSVPAKNGRLVFLIEGLYAVALFLRYAGILQDLALTELLTLVIGLVSLFLAYKTIDQYMPDEKKRLFGKPDPTLKKKNDKNKPGSGRKMPKIVMPKD